MGNTALNRVMVSVLTNKSGGPVAQGDVVIVDSANAAAFTTTTVGAYTEGSLGVVVEPNGIADSATGLVAFCGYVPKISLSGSASLGDLFKTHTAAKQAVRHAAPSVTGDFGEVLGTGATPAAMLWGSTTRAGTGTGDFTGPASSTVDHLVTFADISGKLGKDGGVIPAPGRTLIAEATPNGTATVSFTTIPNTYKKLIIEFVARDNRSSQPLDNLNCQFNADTTAANYAFLQMGEETAGAAAMALDKGNNFILTDLLSGNNAPANDFSIGIIEIIQYANTGFYKRALSRVTAQSGSTHYLRQGMYVLEWANTAAITQIDLKAANGNFVAGSVFRLYSEL